MPNMSVDQTIAAPSPSASANGPPVSPELLWETAWGFQKTAAIKWMNYSTLSSATITASPRKPRSMRG